MNTVQTNKFLWADTCPQPIETNKQNIGVQQFLFLFCNIRFVLLYAADYQNKMFAFSSCNHYFWLACVPIILKPDLVREAPIQSLKIDIFYFPYSNLLPNAFNSICSNSVLLSMPPLSGLNRRIEIQLHLDLNPDKSGYTSRIAVIFSYSVAEPSLTYQAKLKEA